LESAAVTGQPSHHFLPEWPETPPGTSCLDPSTNTFLSKKSIFGVARIPGNLEHPRFVWIGSTTSEVHPPGSQIHNKEQVDSDQSTLGPDFDRREVYGSQDIPMGLEEALPCRLSLSIWCGIDAMSFQDASDTGKGSGLQNRFHRTPDGCGYRKTTASGINRGLSIADDKGILQ
jgi:hypothetical protein